MPKNVSTKNTELGEMLGIPLALQVLLISGGMMFELPWGTLFLAILPYWLGTTIIVARRKRTLTSWDRIFIRWGFPILWLAFVLLAALIRR